MAAGKFSSANVIKVQHIYIKYLQILIFQALNALLCITLIIHNNNPKLCCYIKNCHLFIILLGDNVTSL